MYEKNARKNCPNSKYNSNILITTIISQVFFQLNHLIVICIKVAIANIRVKSPIKLVKKVREYQSHHETINGKVDEVS